MNHTGVEEKFLDFLEGHLSPGEQEQVRAHLEDCSGCRRSFEEYQRVIELTDELSERSEIVGADFAVRVMERLEQENVRPAFFSAIGSVLRSWRIPLATMAIACVALVLTRGSLEESSEDLRLLVRKTRPDVALVRSGEDPSQQGVPVGINKSALDASTTGPMVEVLHAQQRIEEGTLIQDSMLKGIAMNPERIPDGAILARERAGIIGKYAAMLIKRDVPINREDISDSRPISPINIPPGFRAVTINVDRRSGVEGWARPNSRVDVLWTYRDKDNATKVATIVRFTKILSAEGATGTDPAQQKAAAAKDNTTITLLVTERDAKKVELARTLGVLSLSLVGDSVGEGTKSDAQPEVVLVNPILGAYPLLRELRGKEGPVQGRMYVKDPQTARQEAYVLRGRQWVREESKSTLRQASDVPPAQRSVTIGINYAQSLEGKLAPGKPVHVILTYLDQGNVVRAGLVAEFARIVSFQQLRRGLADVSLLLSEAEATRVQLACELGTLSLVLPPTATDKGRSKKSSPSVISTETLLRLKSARVAVESSHRGDGP